MDASRRGRGVRALACFGRTEQLQTPLGIEAVGDVVPERDDQILRLRETTFGSDRKNVEHP